MRLSDLLAERKRSTFYLVNAGTGELMSEAFPTPLLALLLGMRPGPHLNLDTEVEMVGVNVVGKKNGKMIATIAVCLPEGETIDDYTSAQMDPDDFNRLIRKGDL